MPEFNDEQFYQYPPLHPPIPEYAWKKDEEYLAAVLPNADYLETVVSKEADFIVPVVSAIGAGPKGEKGDSMDASIAVVESVAAIHNHAVGSYFVLDNQLYKTTHEIVIGDAISPGTNCAATTVMAELVALTS